ncbi:MAG: hypothetical protein F6K40_12375 [Okeania sp. SIO3I5]|uniref:hypothetical protein n=1 Tax=Okeania sp. SIO3I5 TaxID=2607805 RepID=UPI0013BD8B6F|nr:hypothetical protein [Okeania sp. SIO3I5]NEQ37026.1 hypothetical protein [Okeania sp. SIO3I5]
MVLHSIQARQVRRAKSRCLILLPNFPAPQYKFGDLVKITNTDNKGKIVGMVCCRYGLESRWQYLLDITIDSLDYWGFQGHLIHALDEDDSPCNHWYESWKLMLVAPHPIQPRQVRTAKSRYLNFPSDFPTPEHKFGDLVKIANTDNKGTVVGMICCRYGSESRWKYLLDITIDSLDYWLLQGHLVWWDDEDDSPSGEWYEEWKLISIN